MTANGNFYITTAIPYVNAEPHLGHALELVQADAAARHRRLRGQPVRFLTGTDDHALKNVTAARTAGLAVREFVDANAARFRGLREPLGLSFDDFIRTSADARHRAGVERLWRRCADRGDFYLRQYEGLYCPGCEQFYAPAELDHGVCAEHRAAPERVTEENWRGSTSAPPPAPSARWYRPATGSSKRSAPGSWPAVRNRAIARRPRGWTSCWASW